MTLMAYYIGEGKLSHVQQNRHWMQWQLFKHDVIMSAVASQILSVSIVCSTVEIKENIKALRLWPLCGEFPGDRWIPHTKGQERGKYFHLMTSSCGFTDRGSDTAVLSASMSCTFVCLGSVSEKRSLGPTCGAGPWRRLDIKRKLVVARRMLLNCIICVLYAELISLLVVKFNLSEAMYIRNKIFFHFYHFSTSK